ncbi:MAG: hypothetical protein ABJF50_14010 [Paracoccaceae bacterium]
MNLHQKMEDARARRAEALAHKQPANDDARVPPKPAAKSKVSKKAPVAEAKTSSVAPDAVKKPRPVSEARFPKIIMPDPEQGQQNEEKPRRRIAWLFPMIGLLLALIIGTLYLIPLNTNPTAALSVTEPVAPDQSQGIAQGASATGFEVRPDLATVSKVISLPTTERGAYPVIGSTPPKPSISLASALSALNAADIAPRTPARLPLWLASAAPADLVSPTRDPLFALPKKIELRIALIIPDTATDNAVRAVTTALEKTGFEVAAPRRVSYVIKQTQVRYFHEEDAEPAGLLAEKISGSLRDFTDFAPSPPNGLVEVFIAGRAPATPVERRPEPRGLAGDLRQFGSDLRNALTVITR